MRFLIKNLYRYLGIDIIQYSRIYKNLVKLYTHIYLYYFDTNLSKYNI